MENNLKLSDEIGSALKYNPIDLPAHITENLSARIDLRPYQKEALQHYLLRMDKPAQPEHLMFNMATGSGKTVIMAGIILDSYARGYDTFIFFVNSTAIIEKTKANFLDPMSAKYLFADSINIGGARVEINTCNNFEDRKKDCINIIFTTIQSLYSLLTRVRENALTADDFVNRDFNLVLLADEAHHLNSETKKNLTQAENENKASWENVVHGILHSRKENRMFEFTATIPTQASVQEKYKNKIIFDYPLSQFNKDGYCKTIDLFKYDDRDAQARMLGAVLVSTYRKLVASQYGVYLKPVVLFKSATIKESAEYEKMFFSLIDTLTVHEINKVLRRKYDSFFIKQAFNFLLEQNADYLLDTVKSDFAPHYTVNINDESALEKNQLLVNTLENKDNSVRCVFAVDKLNEGWDVLNLFDIVRMIEGKIKNTPKEAQLIGRGARLFPYNYGEGDKYKRKNESPSDPLYAIESLGYHAISDNEFIAQLKKELEKQGSLFTDGEKSTINLELKEEFVKSEAYNQWYFATNDVVRIKDEMRKRGRLFNRSNLEAKKIINPNFEQVPLFAKDIKEEKMLDEKAALPKQRDEKVFTFGNLKREVVHKAMNKCGDFYHFNTLKKHFEKINTKDDFIEKYLADIRLRLDKRQEMDRENQLHIALFVLQNFKERTDKNLDSFALRPWRLKPLHLLKNKTIVRMQGQTDIQEKMTNKAWFVLKDFVGTELEKKFIEFISLQEDAINSVYKEWYLVRNERNNFMAIYDEKCRRFEPDFYFLGKHKEAKGYCVLQCFIEPKGAHLAEGQDRWKEDFLKVLMQNPKRVAQDENGIAVASYHVTGLPFFTGQNELFFDKDFNSIILGKEA